MRVFAGADSSEAMSGTWVAPPMPFEGAIELNTFRAFGDRQAALDLVHVDVVRRPLIVPEQAHQLHVLVGA